MSEFQSVHFMAVDRPLDEEQLDFMREQSSRAEITPFEFSNEYHYGDFRGDPVKMLQRGYDVHLHYANFGIRRLMFRLPAGMPGEPKLLEAFFELDGVSWRKDKKGPGGILAIEPEADAGSYGEDLYDLGQTFRSLVPVRELLISGDLRPLYLAWLACAYEDDLEPPTPAGLNKLGPSLEAMGEFYEIDLDLLAAAAENSPEMPVPTGTKEPVEVWLARRDAGELRELAARLLGKDAAAGRAETLARVRDELDVAAWPVAEPTRTMGDLRERAEQLRQIRTDREHQAREAKRRKRLASMASNPKQAVASIEAMVQTRSTQSYDQAAEQLAELREALGPEAGPEQTRAIAARIRPRLSEAQRPGRRLEKARLGGLSFDATALSRGASRW